jgi:hypothetical protein
LLKRVVLRKRLFLEGWRPVTQFIGGPMRLYLLSPISIFIAVISTVNCPAQTRPDAGPRIRNANESTFKLADVGMTFVAPAGFTALTESEIATKFPRTRAPRHAIGNASRRTTIVYDLFDNSTPPDLESGRKAMADSLDQRLPDVKWLSNRVTRVGQRDWAYLEFTAPVLDGPIHCIMLMTIVDERVLMFNFNSTEKDFPTVRQALHASIASISVKH